MGINIRALDQGLSHPVATEGLARQRVSGFFESF